MFIFPQRQISGFGEIRAVQFKRPMFHPRSREMRPARLLMPILGLREHKGRTYKRASKAYKLFVPSARAILLCLTLPLPFPFILPLSSFDYDAQLQLQPTQLNSLLRFSPAPLHHTSKTLLLRVTKFRSHFVTLTSD